MVLGSKHPKKLTDRHTRPINSGCACHCKRLKPRRFCCGKIKWKSHSNGGVFGDILYNCIRSYSNYIQMDPFYFFWIYGHIVHSIVCFDMGFDMIMWFWICSRKNNNIIFWGMSFCCIKVGTVTSLESVFFFTPFIRVKKKQWYPS